MWVQGCLTTLVPPAPSSAAAGMESSVSKATQSPGTGRMFVPLSTNHSQASPYASSVYSISLSMCVSCRYTYASRLDLPFGILGDLFLHTFRLFHLTASLITTPETTVVMLYVSCLTQTLQSSTVCLSSLHCVDLY